MKYIITIATILLSLTVQADEVCTVTKVIDGDTFHATCDGKDKKIRMARIDSYESKRNNRAFKQAYEQNAKIEDVVAKGKEAAKITKDELTGKEVTIKPTSDKDPYGREIGEVYVHGEDVNDKLLHEHPNVFLPYK